MRQVPFVVLGLYPGAGALEPLNSYVRQRYAPIELPIGPAVGGLSTLNVYRRKPSAPSRGERFF
jgi:hypothetical protein